MGAGSDGGWLDNWRDGERVDGCLSFTEAFAALATVVLHTEEPHVLEMILSG